MPRLLLAALLAVHGAIHLLGFAKGFGLAEVAALRLPVGRPQGLLWLLAALLQVAAAVLLLASPHRWWMAALPGLVLSQALILGAWSDARFGTVANAIVLLPLAVALLDLRPGSLHSTYQREVGRRLGAAAPTALVTEADLEPLPPQVRTYLRRVGAVGRPRVVSFRARFHGRFRRAPGAPWMDFTAEQYSFYDPPARLFSMKASQFGIPFEALHLYLGRSATMQVRAASAIDVVDARGPEMDRSETVTLFNDLVLMAPAALVDAPVRWSEVDARTVEATYTNAGQTIRARLVFDAQGDLSDFVSPDRLLSADGKTFRSLPWSTPIHGYREMGGVRVLERADAVWKDPAGDIRYGEFVADEIAYDVAARR